MSDITKERWHYDAKTSEIRNERGDVMADGVGEPGPALAVLPEALAELLDSANYDHDGLCRGMAPCAASNHQESCMRKRDVLRRAGVLK